MGKGEAPRTESSTDEAHSQEQGHWGRGSHTAGLARKGYGEVYVSRCGKGTEGQRPPIVPKRAILEPGQVPAGDKGVARAPCLQDLGSGLTISLTHSGPGSRCLGPASQARTSRAAGSSATSPGPGETRAAGAGGWHSGEQGRRGIPCPLKMPGPSEQVTQQAFPRVQRRAAA